MPRHLPRWLTWALIASDIVLINLALVVSYEIRYEWRLFVGLDPAYNNPFSVYIPFAVALTVLLLVTFRLAGVYDQRRSTSLFDTLYSLASGSTIGIMVMIVGTLFLRPVLYSRLILLYAHILNVLFLDDNPQKGETDIGPFKALGGLDKLIGVLECEHVTEVVIALPWSNYRR